MPVLDDIPPKPCLPQFHYSNQLLKDHLRKNIISLITVKRLYINVLYNHYILHDNVIYNNRNV